jgi:glycosyltransferase involved in cell wall biosynthesis
VRPVKILFVARQLVRAGAERQLVVLAAALAARDHDVVVATFRPGDLDEEVVHSRARLVALGAPTRWHAPLAAARLARIARDLRPDIIHGYLDAPNILASVIAPLARPARAVWGQRASAIDPAELPVHARVLYRLEPRLSRTAALVIVNSEMGRRSALARGYPAQSLAVVENGIDAERFVRDPERGRAVRRRYGVEADAPVISRVGRIHPMKDYATFLDVVARVRADEPSVRALCIGAGDDEYVDMLKTRAAAMGLGTVVTWTGPLDDVGAAYSASDVVVSSSRYGEGFPNAVAEGMACETPCVVTDVGDSATLVGDTGHVAAPGDAPALAAGVRALLRDPDRRTRGQRARARVVENFSIARLVDRTLAVLEPLVASTEADATRRMPSS